MRAAFIRSLIESAREDEGLFFLVADVGYSLVEPFAEEFRDRFLNVGIAEQNMTGIAAGLALSGKTVFVYSLANFPTLRCVEHIRNDVCYHEADVKIVCSGGGLTYGSLGTTHHVTQDLAIMRALPGMTVIAPGDPTEAALATRAIARTRRPCYLRLSKTGDPIVHPETPEFQIGKAITVRKGEDVTLIVTGGMLYNTMQAAEQLTKHGIQDSVLSMHTIKPLDAEAVISAGETGAIVTIEEHSIIGGLGSAVAEVLAESDKAHVKFKRMGLNDSFTRHVGGQEYLREVHSLSVKCLVSSILELLGDQRC